MIVGNPLFQLREGKLMGIGFEVTQWKGTKSILITTRTVMGGKNNFLGIAYIVVASICVLLGAAVTARNVFKPRYAFPMSSL